MLRQLDLKTPLLGPGAAGEYVQNQRGAVYDLDVLAKGAFQVALLRRSKLIVQDQGVECPANGPQLLYLALPQVGVPGLVQVLSDRTHHFRSGGASQLRQLRQRILQRP